MPRLLTLSGEPLSWAELHAMNEAWHRARNPRVRVLTGACTEGRHFRCNRRAYPTAARASEKALPCECECHG